MKPLSNYETRKNHKHFVRLRNLYLQMITRTKHDNSYVWREIKVCDEWLGEKGFENFYDWAIANGYDYKPDWVNGKYQNTLTLDRINPYGDYEPNNCRWTDWDTQNHNKGGKEMFGDQKDFYYEQKRKGLPSTYTEFIKHKKIELLLKPNWNYHDIMEYVGCEKSKAYELMKVAREKYKGSVRFNSQCVLRDSLLQVIQTSIERETYILSQIKKGGMYGKTLQKSEVQNSK